MDLVRGEGGKSPRKAVVNHSVLVEDGIEVHTTDKRKPVWPRGAWRYLSADEHAGLILITVWRREDLAFNDAHMQ